MLEKKKKKSIICLPEEKFIVPASQNQSGPVMDLTAHLHIAKIHNLYGL